MCLLFANSPLSACGALAPVKNSWESEVLCTSSWGVTNEGDRSVSENEFIRLSQNTYHFRRSVAWEWLHLRVIAIYACVWPCLPDRQLELQAQQGSRARQEENVRVQLFKWKGILSSSLICIFQRRERFQKQRWYFDRCVLPVSKVRPWRQWRALINTWNVSEASFFKAKRMKKNCSVERRFRRLYFECAIVCVSARFRSRDKVFKLGLKLFLSSELAINSTTEGSKYDVDLKLINDRVKIDWEKWGDQVDFR